MHQPEEADLPPTSSEEAECLKRRQEEAYWVERHDRIIALETRWAFIRSRPPDQQGTGPRCEHVAGGQACTFQRTVGATQLAPLPLRCRLHLLTAFASDLALLLKDDPEKISEHYTVGCLRLLVEERLKGEARAHEAQEALKSLWDALLAWSPMNQGHQTEGR